MPATAIDIGHYSIKAITGDPGDKPKIDKTAEILNTLDFSYPKDDNQAEQLMNLVDAFINDNKLPKTDVRLSLPEEAISTKLIEMPPLSDAELASAVEWQAEQYIPIPQEELALEYQVVFRPPKKVKDEPMKVLLIGTRQSLVERYTQIFLNLGIQPTILETQVFSIIRALGFETSDPSTLITHIGAETMTLTVIDQQEIKLSLSHKGGGNLLTKSLQRSIENIDTQQAEQYKRSYGLDPDQLQGKIRQTLISPLDSLITEIDKTIKFYKNQNPNEPISRIVLSGGTAQLPGLVEYLSQATGLEVFLASPFAPAQGNIPPNNHQALIVCIGLLMRTNK